MNWIKSFSLVDWLWICSLNYKISLFRSKKLSCHNSLHCVKSVQIRSYFWSVFSCIQSKYRKIRTRNNSIFGHFSRSVMFTMNMSSQIFHLFIWSLRRRFVVEVFLNILRKTPVPESPFYKQPATSSYSY